MNTIDPTVLSRYQHNETSPERDPNALGQDEFLKLMVTQLRHQDPFKPMENGEFIGQMAQFSTVTGIDEMQGSLENLASSYGSSQTLEASRLIDREVLVETDRATLTDTGTIDGRFELPSASGNVELSLSDSSGRVLRTQSLGEFAAGRHDFSWDGLDDAGKRVAPGDYQVSLRAASGDEFTAVTPMLARVVDSVEFAQGIARLITANGESLSLLDIREIRKPDSTDSSNAS